MSTTTETVQVAAVVPVSLAADLRGVASANERSVAAEIRLALRAWVEAAKAEQAA
jgi:hypothetical protein